MLPVSLFLALASFASPSASQSHADELKTSDAGICKALSKIGDGCDGESDFGGLVAKYVSSGFLDGFSDATIDCVLKRAICSHVRKK